MKLSAAFEASIALSFGDVSDAYQFFPSTLGISDNPDYRANLQHCRITDIDYKRNHAGVSDHVPGSLVGGDVVHHDDVAGCERRRQDLLDILEEDGPRHGAIHDIGRRDASQAQAGDQRRGLPVAMGHRLEQTLAAQTAAPRHLCGRSRFVQEDQVLRLQGRLPDDEPPARLGDVRPSLLGGVQTFFDGDPVAFEEPPDRRLADANAMPGRQFRADLGQRQVRLMSDKRQDRLAMPTQARAMVTTHWSGARLTLGTPPLRIAVLSLTPNRSAAAGPNCRR